jgi:hydroxyacyl-ACP dehydratase HTD2-like protein with hotdog domain
MDLRRPPAIHTGILVPPLERQLTQMRLVAYGAATWDWHRLHYDSEYAIARNIPRPVVDGQMFGALLAEALIDWLGPDAFIRRLSFRLRAMVFAGETVRCEGEVTSAATEINGTILCVSQRVRVGDKIAVDAAHSEIFLPRR